MYQSTGQNIQVYTKIQQASSLYSPTFINKQVGYFVHIETDKLYKIKNCTDSDKTNAELYKRFSKDFISNVKKGTDQMIMCCGLEENVRMETSIGCKKNPGMFLIVGIGILDEKYQEDFTKMDIEISFMEYSDGKFYDLLSYTKIPLRALKKQDNTCYGQTFCKISTFNQFLKLLKIALFNNKQRDIKIENYNHFINNQDKVKSSLIMTIVTKKYSNVVKNNSTLTQKTIVIDFAGSKPSTFQQDSNGSQKNVWDYFLIELNNLTCKKKLHYHLVQPNPLLSLVKNSLKTGKTFILSSFSTNLQYFERNYKYFTQLYGIADSITKQNQPIYPSTSMSSTIKDKWQTQANNSLSQQKILQIICQRLDSLFQGVRNRRYPSLRQYRQIRQKILNVITHCLEWIHIYHKIFKKVQQNKRLLRLSQNQIVADQINLIGICVKSQHYKDFYESKSYISLQRQIIIKTQQTKQNIIRLMKNRLELKQKFMEMKSKHNQFVQSVPNENQVGGMKGLAVQLLQFFQLIFYNTLLYSQRTVADQILKQENISQNLLLLSKKLSSFQKQINQMGKKGNILFQTNQFKKDAHLAILVKEVQNMVLKQKKNLKKREIKANQLQKQNIQKNNTNSYVGKFTKLPDISEKRPTFNITGSIQFSSLLINPDQYKQQSI